MANSDELITLRFNAIPGNNSSVIDALNQIKYALDQITKMAKTVNSTSAFAALDAEAKKFQSTLQSVQQQQAKGQIISTQNIKNVNSISQSTNALGVTLQKMTQNQFGKAFNMQTEYGKKGSAAFADSMDRLGYAVMATPKTLGHFITNMRTANSALRDTSKAGIATAESIRAAAGGAPTLVQGLSGMQKASAMIRLAKSNLDGYTQAWGAAVKEQQWAGRQMIQGISLPLTLMATRAISSWRSIETEILSIKKVTDFKGLDKNAAGINDVKYDKLRKEINATALAYGASTKAVAHTYQEVVQLGVRGSKNIDEYVKSVQNLSLLGNMDTDAAFQFFRTTKALFSDSPDLSMIDSIEKTNVVMGQLNAIADNTSVKLSDLAAGIPEVAPVMSQMGFSAAATASSLAGMYNRGIPATEAAHGLKFALQRLVNPTKKAKEHIADLGFTFFNANGSMSDASAKMLVLGAQFDSMSDKQRASVAPELFGTRQAARMNSYFNDLAAGKIELDRLAAGTIKLENVTSDFIKGMIYSGEIKIKGIDVDDPSERYKHAVEMYKKDPTTAIARLKTAMNQLFVQIGANIAPTLVAVGEKLLAFLQKLQDAPPIFYKVALAVGAFAAAMGPLKYAAAMAQYSLMSLLKVATFMVPGITNITNAQALMNGELLATKKVMQLGSKTFMLGGGGGVKNAVYGKLGQFDKINVGGDLSVAQARLASAAATDALFEAEARLTALAPVNIDLQNGQVITNANLIAGRDLLLGTTTGLTTQERLLALELVDEAIALEANSAALLVNAAARDADLVAAEKQAAGLATTAAAQKGGLVSQLAPVVIAKKVGGAIKTGAVGAVNGIKGLGPKIASIFSGGFKAAFTSLGNILKGGIVSFSWITLIVAAIIAAVFILIVLFKGIKSHWGQVMAAMKPGIDALKAGFDRVKDAFTAVIDRFKSIIGQLGTGGSEGEKASSVWEGIGTAAGAVADIIGTALGWLGNLIGWLMPAFELIFYTVKDMVGFVFALFTGDWVNALKYAGAMLYEMLGRPVVLVAQFVAGVFARLVDKILGGASAILKVIGLGDVGKSLDGWGDSMRDFANNPSWVSDLDKTFRSGLGGVFGEAVNEGANKAKPDAEKAGNDLGTDVGEAMNQGVADSASGTSWVETWISKVYGNLDKELEKIKKSAMASLEKANEAAMKVYDARIKAIDDQEKAEEKLFKTQEYLAKRRELLDKRELDNNNYKKARYIAVYEGRYDDARKLDLEHSKTVAENNKSINDLDDDRSKDLLKEERSTKKDQINLEKETAKEKWDIQKQSLEDHIDLIIKYAPATIGEFQSMMDQINQIVVDNGGELPAVAQSAMDTMLQVFKDSNAQIADEFLRAGKDSRSAWMIGFASANSVAIIATQAGSGGGGGEGAGAGGGAAGALAALNPEEKAAFDSFIAHANMPPVPDPTQQQISDWIGSGAGMGSVGASGTTAGMNSIRPEAKSVTANEIDNVITKYSGSTANYRNENGNKSTYIEYDPIHNFGEVYKILALLDKGVSENQIKDKALYLGFTDETITAALNIYKRGARQATVTSQSVEDSWGKTTTRISTAFGLSEKDISRHGDNINKNFTVYTDKMGSQWKVVNGVLQDQFGTAAEFIKNESGEVTGVQIIGTNKVRDVTISNIGKAEEIFKQLTTEGIRPGTAEAEALIQKIKDLGFEVLQVNGKTVLINIDLNDPNHVVKTLNAIDTTGADFGETVWINGNPMMYTAAGLASSPDYVKNESGVWVKKATGGAYSASAGAFKMATGGMVQYAGGGSLVKNRKDGILANIGEGGYDEYVITTDPKYRAANVGYLAAASAQLGVRAQAGATIRAAAGYSTGLSGSSRSSGGGGGGAGDGGVVGAGGSTTTATDTVKAALDSMTAEQKTSFEAFVAGNTQAATQGTAEQAAAHFGYVNGVPYGVQDSGVNAGISFTDQAKAYADLFGTTAPYVGYFNDNLDYAAREVVNVVKEQIKNGNHINEGTEAYRIALQEVTSAAKAETKNREAAAAATKEETEARDRANAEGAAALYGGYAYESTLTPELSSGQKAEKAVVDFLKSLAGGSSGPAPEGTPNPIDVLYSPPRQNSAWLKGISEIKRATESIPEAMSRSVDVAGQDIGKALGASKRTLKTYTADGKMFFEDLSGNITDEFGNSARFIADSYGSSTGTIVANNGDIMKSTVNTSTTGQEVVDYMNKQGLDPASDKAKFFKDRINEVGGVVKELDGKSIYIDLNMGSEDFWTKFDTLNAWTKTFEGAKTIAAIAGNILEERDGRIYMTYNSGIYEGQTKDVTNEYGSYAHMKKASGGAYSAAAGAFKMAMGGIVQYSGGGSLVKNRKNGILANIGEGGYDEYVITTDPKYRAANVGYLAAASAQLGVRSQAGAAIRAAAGYSMGFSGSSGSSGGGGGGGQSGDVYICVDTFVGEEAWFNELMKKYDMKITPQERRKIGQQRRTISSYNDRYSIK